MGGEALLLLGDTIFDGRNASFGPIVALMWMSGSGEGFDIPYPQWCFGVQERASLSRGKRGCGLGEHGCGRFCIRGAASHRPDDGEYVNDRREGGAESRCERKRRSSATIKTTIKELVNNSRDCSYIVYNFRETAPPCDSMYGTPSNDLLLDQHNSHRQVAEPPLL